MEKHCPRVLIAAPSSGSGKTTVVCGLLKALLMQGLDCVSFKCGPDYIDPMFHKYVLGVSGGNLDSFFLDEPELKQMLAQKAAEHKITVIEGVMGYYDGLGGVSTTASTYEVACMTDSPVVLVVDGKGASLSIVALIKGFMEYKENHQIQGVILNRVSSGMAKLLTPAIEELGVTVLGSLPENPMFRFESRHLGLLAPEEIQDINVKLAAIAEQMKASVDLEALLRIADSAPPMEKLPAIQKKYDRNISVRIGVAQDEAFCFYYQENLELLEQMGAELIPFSPIHDKYLPKHLDGLLLGGGYPENYASRLSSNQSMLSQLRQAAERQLPILAECGGYMYLLEELEGSDGVVYPMAAVIPGRGYKTNRLSRFGYINLKNKKTLDFMDGTVEIKGHEFHYWDSTDNGADFLAEKPLGSKSWQCIHAKLGMLAGYPHLYYRSNPELIADWLTWCRNVRKDK